MSCHKLFFWEREGGGGTPEGAQTSGGTLGPSLEKHHFYWDTVVQQVQHVIPSPLSCSIL